MSCVAGCLLMVPHLVRSQVQACSTDDEHLLSAESRTVPSPQSGGTEERKTPAPDAGCQEAEVRWVSVKTNRTLPPGSHARKADTPLSSPPPPFPPEETWGRQPKKRRAPSPGTALTQGRYTFNFVLCGNVLEAVAVVCTSWYNFWSCWRSTQQCLSSSTVSGLADLMDSTDELHMEIDAALVRCLGVDAATVHIAGVATAFGELRKQASRSGLYAHEQERWDIFLLLCEPLHQHRLAARQRHLRQVTRTRAISR